MAREYLKKRTTRTVYGNAVQTALALNKPHKVVANSTLNEKLTIKAVESVANFDRPEIKMFVIGIGGHSFTLGKGNVPLPTAVEHETTDAALYQQIPFVVRAVGDDLTTAERARFRLRKLIQVSNVTYIAYYGRLFDSSNTDIAMTTNVRDNNTGNISTTPFIPTSANLNPQPPVTSNNGEIPASDTYQQVNAEVDLTMSSADLAELRDVARILFGDEAYAMVSEWGVCSCSDTQATGDDGAGNKFQYTESLAVQINDHITSGEPRTAENVSIAMTVNMGASDPLLAQGTRTASV